MDNERAVELLAHVVTYNSADTIAVCLGSLLALDGFRAGENLRIVVTDNASSDGTADLVRRSFGSFVELRENRENAGFSRAHNNMFEEAVRAKIPYVLIVNPDAFLLPSCAQQLISALAHRPRIGMVTPKILRTDTELKPLQPPRIDAAGMCITPSIRHFDRGSEEIDRGQFDRLEFVFGCTGAVCLFRREFLDDVAHRTPDKMEVFDDLFFAFREDADLSWRAQSLGWECLYEPRACAYHRRTVTPERRSSLAPEINRLGVQNRFLLQLKNLRLHGYAHCLFPALLRNLLVAGAVITVERESLPAFRTIRNQRAEVLRKRREISLSTRIPAAYVGRWFDARRDPTGRPALRYEAAARPITSVVLLVVNYNSGSRLRRALEHFFSQPVSALEAIRWRIVVWDNASADGSADSLPAHAQLRVIRSPENAGFAAAINSVAAEEESDSILIMNPDVEIAPSSVAELISSLDSCATCGALAPLLVHRDGTPQLWFSVKELPSFWSTFSDISGLTALWRKMSANTRYDFERDPFREKYLSRSKLVEGPSYDLSVPLEAPQPAAACVLVRSEAFRELGGFDSSFFPAWFEDVDFFKRMWSSRWQAAIDSRITAIHEGGYSLSSLERSAFEEIYYGNMLRYWLKHGTPWERALLRVFVPLGYAARGVAGIFWHRLSDGRFKKRAQGETKWVTFKQVMRSAMQMMVVERRGSARDSARGSAAGTPAKESRAANT